MNSGCSKCANCNYTHYSNSFIIYTCMCGKEYNICLQCDDKIKDVVNIKTEFLQKFQYFYINGDKIYYDLCDEREYFGKCDMIRNIFNFGTDICHQFFCNECISKCELICPICCEPSDAECIKIHNLKLNN